MPVDGTLTSGFRPPDRPTHDGIDIAALKGTPVRAAAAGTVILVACNASLNSYSYSCDQDGTPAVAGCGWYLEILHASNIVTRYCHLLRRPDVALGAMVAAGQPIGVVGTSGNSSGPHLHFEVHIGHPETSANAVDPLSFLPDLRPTRVPYAHAPTRTPAWRRRAGAAQSLADRYAYVPARHQPSMGLAGGVSGSMRSSLNRSDMSSTNAAGVR